jgi:hypothetical protein
MNKTTKLNLTVAALLSMTLLVACPKKADPPIVNPPIVTPPIVAPVVVPPVVVVDTSPVVATIANGTLNIQLRDAAIGTWVRLLLADGSVSTVTTSPYCQCLGLGGQLTQINVKSLPGLKVEYSDTQTGPWLNTPIQ